MPPHPAPLGPFARTVRAIYFPLGKLLAQLWRLPLWLKSAAFVTALVVAGLGAYYAIDRYTTSQRNRAVGVAWKRFEEAVKAGKDDDMKAALREVLASSPGDQLAASRLKGLESGESDPADAPMSYLALRARLKAGDSAGAEREADKCLAHRPNDWLARCVKCSAALQAGDPARAASELDKLPDPEAPDAHVEPGGLMFAYELHRRLGRDPSKLRAFAQAFLPRILANPRLDSSPPGDRISLVECYLMGFDPAPERSPPPTLVSGWAKATQRAAQATQGALDADDRPALTRAARLAPGLAAAVGQLRRHNYITTEEFAQFSAEIEKQAQTAWAALLAQNDKLPEAYAGLTLSLARAGDFKKAIETVAKGREVCPDDPELNRLWGRVLQGNGLALQSFGQMLAKARARPQEPVWWALAVDAAAAAGRRDLALEACAELRKLRPSDRGAALAEARLYLETGDGAKAVAVLGTVPEAERAGLPDFARATAQALGLAGLGAQFAPFYEACERESFAKNAPRPAEDALRGYLNAGPDAQRAEAVRALAERLGTRFPDAAEPLKLRAEALFQLAELSGHDSTAVARALEAVERVRAKYPADRELAERQVALHLYGTKDFDAAYRAASVLREAESDPALTPATLELLGQSYLKSGRADEAVRVLARATAMSEARAGCYTQLALALAAAGRPGEARRMLAEAQIRPRSAREQRDYFDAARQLVQGPRNKS